MQTGITAHAGGGQANAVQLTAMNCFIQNVATAGDSVKLPPAKVGMEITVINQSATATGPNVFRRPARRSTLWLPIVTTIGRERRSARPK